VRRDTSHPALQGERNAFSFQISLPLFRVLSLSG
jgi:hypothetical protein